MDLVYWVFFICVQHLQPSERLMLQHHECGWGTRRDQLIPHNFVIHKCEFVNNKTAENYVSPPIHYALIVCTSCMLIKDIMFLRIQVGCFWISSPRVVTQWIWLADEQLLCCLRNYLFFKFYSAPWNSLIRFLVLILKVVM